MRFVYTTFYLSIYEQGQTDHGRKTKWQIRKERERDKQANRQTENRQTNMDRKKNM